MTDAGELFAAVDDLYQHVVGRGAERYDRWAPRIARAHARLSAYNLAAYLAFRERDLRTLQDRLAPLGLSSLGRLEAQVVPAIGAVRATLGAIAENAAAAAARPRARDFALGKWLLARNTRALFGRVGLARPHIMVTLGTEAASDPLLVRRLVDAGMDSARINCAHDDAETWSAMARNVRSAARDAGRTCRISMDIAGPKIRVGEVRGHHPGRRFRAGDTVTLTCTEPLVYAHVATGAPVWIDDGKLGGTVRASNEHSLTVCLTSAGPDGGKIKPGKGLNFPQSTFPLPALGEKDLADLDRIVLDADIVGQSFVRTAADVETLINELTARGKRLPIVAKVETAAAIEHLPEIIVAGSAAVPFGVMIARGDLAIEIGYQRLAEMQEELLWVCEAAHVPVIWATQILEDFIHGGTPSRAEMTDAAMSERAECVMLNKGPYIVEGVTLLNNVLTRMQGHQTKKSSRLRALQTWTDERSM